MRICLYTYTALPKLGGQEMVVDALARHLVEKEHDVIVLAPYPRKLKTLDDGQYPYRMVRHPRFFSTRHGVGWYRFFLQRLFRKRPFDILHCHGIYPSGYVAALARDQLGVPTVLTEHGGNVYENSPHVAKRGVRERMAAAVRAPDRLIAISRFTREGYLGFGADPAKIVTIPNGVDITPLSIPAVRPDDLDSFVTPNEYFLFIGRLRKQKGADVLLHAMTRLGDDVRLVIAGDGDERESLRALCTQLGLNHRVRFVGAVRGALKNYLFQHCIATVVPSRRFEAFGLVTIESYAAGRPVIASRLPGLADLVDPGVTGLIVDPDSPEQLADAMKQMTHASATMRSAASAAAGQYAWSTIVDRHIALYEELFASSAQ